MRNILSINKIYENYILRKKYLQDYKNKIKKRIEKGK